MSERLFKCLAPGRFGPYSGYQWPDVGRRVTADGPLIACANGVHLCREQDLIFWLDAEIWEAGYFGERIDGDDKIVVREGWLIRQYETWNKRTQRLFSADCAEHVLPIFERQCPGDPRVRDCIATARAFARGEATQDDLVAAQSAAFSAYLEAFSAEYSAAFSAAYSAALSAARSAFSSALSAVAAAGSEREACLAERQWQTARLFQYLDGEIE